MRVGAAFGDHIRTEKLVSRKFNYDKFSDGSHVRDFLCPIFIVLFSCILLVKLFFLQVVHGQDYRNLSDNNRIRTTVIHAPRGIIFDKTGKPLVYNIPGFRETIKGKTRLIDNKEALGLLSKNDSNLEIDSLRQYPYKESLAHILGYVGQISLDELGLQRYATYKTGEIIGKMGIEKRYEASLKGIDGKKLIEMDAVGKATRTLGQTDPIAGKNISLTIDSSLQERVFDAMKDITKGAAIVSGPHGEILAMVSKPSFDPNMFTLGKNYKKSSDARYQSVGDIILDNENQPLLNRVIGGVYPPGSTFKLITAAAGLETHTIDSNFMVEDTGILKVGDFSFANWYFTEYGRTEGEVDVVKAIKRSNDIFFYKVADMVGVDVLSGMAKKFGVGEESGIDIDGEVSGLLPSKAWKEKTFGESWYLGDNYHYGIGQGYLLTTPLQVNIWTQAIANAGTIYKPHLLKNNSESNMVPIKENFLHKKTVDLIKEGMIESCNTGGVAWPLFDYSIKNKNLEIDNKNFLPVASSSAEARHVTIACKTGTAQHGDEHTLPHSWITLFAPAFNPQVVITVLAEASGEGSNVAGPIAKKILDAWFQK